MNTLQKKKSRLFKLILILIAVLAVFVTIGNGFSKPQPLEAKHLKAELHSVIIEKTGTITNMNKKRISDIIISRSSAAWDVELFLQANKRPTMMLTKETMWQQTIDILDAMSELDKIEDVSFTWIYPVLNTQEQVEDTGVMSFRLDKTTRDQLVWENVEPSILQELVYDYKEHPFLTD